MGGRGARSGGSGSVHAAAQSQTSLKTKKIEKTLENKNEKYNWTTEKGSKIELEIEREPDTFKDDWGTVHQTGKDDHIYVKELSINGNKMESTKIGYDMHLKESIVKGKKNKLDKQEIGAKLPKDVYQSIYGERDKKDAQWRKNIIKDARKEKAEKEKKEKDRGYTPDDIYEWKVR